MSPLYPPYAFIFPFLPWYTALPVLISAHQYTSVHFIVSSPLLGPLPGSGMHFLHSEQCLIILFTLPKLSE